MNIKRKNLRTFLQYNRWLWTPAALLMLLVLPITWAAHTLWEAREDFVEAVIGCVKVIVHKVDD